MWHRPRCKHALDRDAPAWQYNEQSFRWRIVSGGGPFYEALCENVLGTSKRSPLPQHRNPISQFTSVRGQIVLEWRSVWASWVHDRVHRAAGISKPAPQLPAKEPEPKGKGEDKGDMFRAHAYDKPFTCGVYCSDPAYAHCRLFGSLALSQNFRK